jgi:hypothetical protein
MLDFPKPLPERQREKFRRIFFVRKPGLPEKGFHFPVFRFDVDFKDDISDQAGGQNNPGVKHERIPGTIISIIAAEGVPHR